MSDILNCLLALRKSQWTLKGEEKTECGGRVLIWKAENDSD